MDFRQTSFQHGIRGGDLKQIPLSSGVATQLPQDGAKAGNKERGTLHSPL